MKVTGGKSNCGPFFDRSDFGGDSMFSAFAAGINGVLKSIPLKPEDGILIHSYTYNAIRNVAQAAADRVGKYVVYHGLSGRREVAKCV